MRRTRWTSAAWATATVLLLSPTIVGRSTRIAVLEGRPSPPAQLHSGAPETTGPAAERRAAVQEELDRVDADIEQDSDGRNIPSFAGLQLDVDASAVDVYWVGQPPERVRRIVDAARPT